MASDARRATLSGLKDASDHTRCSEEGPLSGAVAKAASYGPEPIEMVPGGPHRSSARHKSQFLDKTPKTLDITTGSPGRFPPPTVPKGLEYLHLVDFLQADFL